MVQAPVDKFRSHSPVNPVARGFDSRGHFGDGSAAKAPRAKQTSDSIRADIDRTRHRLDHTIDELQARLSPKPYLRAMFEAMRSNTDDATRRVMTAVRKNPLPIALIGLGIIWFAVNQARQKAPVPRAKAIVHYEEEVVFSEAAL